MPASSPFSERAATRSMAAGDTEEIACIATIQRSQTALQTRRLFWARPHPNYTPPTLLQRSPPPTAHSHAQSTVTARPATGRPPAARPPHPPSRPSEVGTGHAYHFAPLATLAATVLPTRPTTSTLTLTNPHPLPRSRDGHLTALPPLPFRPRGSPARPRLSATHRSATETPRADVATENFKLPRANATFTPTVGHRQTTLGWLPARAVPTRSRHGVCCSPRHRCRSPVPGQCSR